jgi:putative intracellular protease/amidase
MLAKVSKAVAALAAGLAIMVAAGLITGKPAVWGTTGVEAVMQALAVYMAPANKKVSNATD